MQQRSARPEKVLGLMDELNIALSIRPTKVQNHRPLWQ